MKSEQVSRRTADEFVELMLIGRRFLDARAFGTYLLSTSLFTLDAYQALREAYLRWEQRQKGQ